MVNADAQLCTCAVFKMSPPPGVDSQNEPPRSTNAAAHEAAELAAAAAALVSLKNTKPKVDNSWAAPLFHAIDMLAKEEGNAPKRVKRV